MRADYTCCSAPSNKIEINFPVVYNGTEYFTLLKNKHYGPCVNCPARLNSGTCCCFFAWYE